MKTFAMALLYVAAGVVVLACGGFAIYDDMAPMPKPAAPVIKSVTTFEVELSETEMCLVMVPQWSDRKMHQIEISENAHFLIEDRLAEWQRAHPDHLHLGRLPRPPDDFTISFRFQKPKRD